MKDWLAGEYLAIIFTDDIEPKAYALYKESLSEIYLRQFFVRRECRRQGIGQKAIAGLFLIRMSTVKRLFRDHIWFISNCIAFRPIP